MENKEGGLTPPRSPERAYLVRAWEGGTADSKFIAKPVQDAESSRHKCNEIRKSLVEERKVRIWSKTEEP